MKWGLTVKGKEVTQTRKEREEGWETERDKVKERGQTDRAPFSPSQNQTSHRGLVQAVGQRATGKSPGCQEDRLESIV